MATNFTNVDDYIHSFPAEIQTLLNELRQTIKGVIPNASEVISYQIPCFKVDGKYVIYFSAWKDHLSIYPIPDGPESFKKKIAPYKAGKGTLRFALNTPLPHELIKQVAVRLLEQRS